MKKLILLSLSLIFIIVILIGCSNISTRNEVLASSVEPKDLTNVKAQEQTNTDEVLGQKKIDEIIKAPYVPNLVTYKSNNIAVFIEQHIYLKYYTDLVEGKDSNKTSIVLKYVKDSKINKIDLTEMSKKNSFRDGVKHITTSPSGKYIALEFGSADCNKTVLIDTEKNTAIVLQEAGILPMVSVSWKYDNDNLFIYFTAFQNERTLKIYDLKTESSKIVETIKDNRFTTIDSIMNWKNEYIEIIDSYSDKVILIKDNID